MSCYVGIDIGAVGAKAALLTDRELGEGSLGALRLVESSAGRFVYVGRYLRTRGRPLEAATALLDDVVAALGDKAIAGLCLTGSGSELVAKTLQASVINEFKAIAAGLATLKVLARTVFEMGGETSKYLRLSPNDDGSYGIVDYSTNGDCAAGTGSFIDQQCGRLKYNVEEVGELVLSAERAAQVAGRCSVFAKSDMIHAQQKGYSPAEVLRGLCNAVARNFKMAVVRSHPVEGPVVFLGGVAANAAVVRAMREVFTLDDSQMSVPQDFQHVAAIGAATVASQASSVADLSHLSELRSASDSARGEFPTAAPLAMDNVLLLRDRVQSYESEPGHGGRIDAYLGIDIGSVSTNVVAVDEEGQVIHEIYVRTMGRPIQVVRDAMLEVEQIWGSKLNVRGVGTTGSGRELIGELIGADTINDEITAHKTGASFISQKMLGRCPDTIFEIGGQDAKFISLQDGIVVDFTMNEACAAGTGSFLEERAEELDIAIKSEFARLALSSKAPIRLGERCTVFMERDVNSYMQRGADKADLVAGLAYSVVYNYINRVVRGRKIGQCIFFQGGTAYNDAVAAAFAAVTGKQIIVPPHNGVMGAIGSALLARDKMSPRVRNRRSSVEGLIDTPTRTVAQIGQYVTEQPQESPAAEVASNAAANESRFRGYELDKVDYSLREFTCKGCSNSCSIQEFDVEGEKTYWGDKCSDRFRRRVKAARKPVIEDLFALRSKLLLDDSNLPKLPDTSPVCGIPMTMFALEWLPFWRTLLANCGYRTVLSSPTNKQIIQAGQASVVAEPCFPIIVAHGHVAELAKRDDVDFVLLPNILSMETPWMHTEAHLCPWHQTLPFMVRRSPAVEPQMHKFLTPLVRFRQGRASATRELVQFFTARDISKAQVEKATAQAFAAQDKFIATCQQAGKRAMETLTASGEPGIVMLGRPYNTHDAGVNLSVAQKLREYYGVNCIPLDFLPAREVDIQDINDNMFWNLGHRIIAGSRIVSRHDNLHVIYITNFKCGPDSFIKHFIRRASGKPFLTLQFDGHSNDAGMMTRCEAYLDSKGILRPWQAKQKSPTDQLAASASER